MRNNNYISGLLFKLVWILLINIKKILSTSYCTLNAKIKGIEVGKHNISVGRTILVRKPKSKITIGNKCEFISDESTILIGINRKCMISTHSKNSIIEIGNNCGFSGTVIASSQSIVIGNNVLCGANTLVTDFDLHNIAPSLRHTVGSKSASVFIHNNV